MKKLNSKAGNLDSNTKNEIINNAITNQSNNEVLTVDNQLNENIDNFEKKEMSEFRITNNKTGSIQRNVGGFLIIDDNSDKKIQAGLIAKKYDLKNLKEKVNTEIKNLR